MLHLISHTHWDREWYLPFQEFRLKLVRLIDLLLDILATDPDYKFFMLDGQTIVLDDYLEVRPERAAALRAHVRSGRILVGPWHILPDEFLVSPEATIRNLMRGLRRSKDFGEPMPIGYIPDPFGHISQLPQILRGFGIEVAVFRRGLSDEPTEIEWQAPDGSRVLTVYLRDGYDNAAWLKMNEAEFVEDIKRLEASLAPHAVSSHMLLMHGTDHMRPHRELTRLMRYANTQLEDKLIHSTLPQYVAAVKQSLEGKLDEIGGDKKGLSRVKGELRDPKRHHLLPGVLSTRMWIKQRNFVCEHLLEKWTEPFTAFAARLTQPLNSQLPTSDVQPPTSNLQLPTSNHRTPEPAKQAPDAASGRPPSSRVARDALRGPGAVLLAPDAGSAGRGCGAQSGAGEARFGGIPPNPQFALEDFAWRMLMQNHPHDSICGCSVDQVHREMQVRFDAVEQIGGMLAGEALSAIAAQVNAQGSVVFNPTGHARTEWLEHENALVEDVPPFGWKALSLQPVQAEVKSGHQIENELFAVSVDPSDGTLTIHDKRTGATFAGLNRLVDGGDCGDEYNYAPPANDQFMSRPSAAPQITVKTFAEQHSQLTIAMSYRLPAALSTDRHGRADERVEMPITVGVSLTRGVPRVDVRMLLENRASDHRLRVHFPAPLNSEEWHTENHFDVIARGFDLPYTKEHAEPVEAWVEQPQPTAPQRTFADIHNGTIGLMIANHGLPEIEGAKVQGGTELRLSLLRCVGWLSRDDFSTRKGHAGPMLATPEAQCLGVHAFEWAIIPHAGDWQTAFRHAHAFATPLRVIPTLPSHPALHPVGERGALPEFGSFLQVEPKEFVVTAVKNAVEGEGLIVRGYNIGEEPIEARLKLWWPIRQAWRVNLNEENIGLLDVREVNQVMVGVRPKEIVTMRLMW